MIWFRFSWFLSLSLFFWTSWFSFCRLLVCYTHITFIQSARFSMFCRWKFDLDFDRGCCCCGCCWRRLLFDLVQKKKKKKISCFNIFSRYFGSTWHGHTYPEISERERWRDITAFHIVLSVPLSLFLSLVGQHDGLLLLMMMAYTSTLQIHTHTHRKTPCIHFTHTHATYRRQPAGFFFSFFFHSWFGCCLYI